MSAAKTVAANPQTVGGLDQPLTELFEELRNVPNNDWHAAPSQPVGSALTDEQLARIAYKGFDDYWTEDCAGGDTEAWAASAKAVIAALTPEPAALPAEVTDEQIRKTYKDACDHADECQQGFSYGRMQALRAVFDLGRATPIAARSAFIAESMRKGATAENAAIVADAIAAQAAAAEVVVWALRFPDDPRINLSTMFDTEQEAIKWAEKCGHSSSIVVPLYLAAPAQVVAAIQAALALFPICWDTQAFRINDGPLLEADGDTEFYSKKRVGEFIVALHGHLKAAADRLAAPEAGSTSHG